MTIGLRRFSRMIAIWLIILQAIGLLLCSTLAISGTAGSHHGDQWESMRNADVSRILSVLESKIRDQKLLEKAKDKLFTLTERQTRLIASLSDRVAKEEDSGGAGLAFLLMTALIVLS